MTGGTAMNWIGELTKGLPPSAPGMDIGEIGKQGWNLLGGDLPLPAAVLRQSALERNEEWMRAFRKHMGVRLAPHAKTTMSRELIQRQLDSGAWAITVATVHQIRICRKFGIDRIILANQLIGRQEIDYVLSELKRDPDFEFYCLVDSLAGVEMLKEGIARNDPGRPLNLLVEGGEAGGRTGCRSLEEALQVARAVHEAAPKLALCGVEGYEGLNAGADDEVVAGFLRFIVEIAEACDSEGLFAADPVLLSAGGSAFFDMVAEEFPRAKLSRAVEIIIRSGCYIAHDSLLYARAMERIVGRNPELEKLGPPPPEAALEVWAHVQSRPEPEKAILTMGKRDVSYDVELPVALKWSRQGGAPAPIPDGHKVTGLNDQHTHLEIPADSPLEVGDMVGFGISHPCTTFDKWQMLYLVDDDYSVIGAVRTWF